MRALFLVGLLLTAGLLAGCTSQNDGDGLDAQAEGNGWGVRVTYANGTVREYQVTSDPTKADTDGDGLDDFQEFNNGADPRNVDTDGDRLLDGTTQCPEEGSERYDAYVRLEILEHPEKPGCFLGEMRWEYEGTPIATDPANADTDSNPTIGDGLTDSEEILGWEVTVGTQSYHVWSNPAVGGTDSDGDGLHDGLEKDFNLDPTKKDTEGDGVSDLQDAAPLGNLVISLHLESIDLKSNYRLTGGARLQVNINVAETTATMGPTSIQQGNNRLDETRRLDVPDRATSFGDTGVGAGNWANEMSLTFLHKTSSGGEDPIEVRSGDSGHVLRLTYDAFEDTWTGDAQGGTSSGPDADVTLEPTSEVVQAS